jgi:hypothetical protein
LSPVRPFQVREKEHNFLEVGLDFEKKKEDILKLSFIELC